jgi:dihydrofolate reductase
MSTSRKVVQSVLVSLNGVVGLPHTWTGELFGPEEAARSLAALERADAMLMGRVTYEVFAGFWPHGSGPYPDAVNAIRKYVFSNSIGAAEWQNTTVVGGEPVDGVRRLLDQDGGTLAVYGHGRFGQTLHDAGLVDELNVAQLPVFVPDGSLLFRPGGARADWELVDTERSATGIVWSRYHPARVARPAS